MTAGETPAGMLRRAATLMREQAEAATQGPWRAVAGHWEGDEFAAVVASEGDPGDPETWLMATGHGAVSQKADACHAAFMHPGVALAIADWLDAAAVTAGRTEAEGAFIHPDSHALKVALAYLGEAS